MDTVMYQRLLDLLIDINTQIAIITEEAKQNGTIPHNVKYTDGNYVLPPLLLAKAQTLNTMAMLERS